MRSLSVNLSPLGIDFPGWLIAPVQVEWVEFKRYIERNAPSFCYTVLHNCSGVVTSLAMITLVTKIETEEGQQSECINRIAVYFWR